MENKTETPVFIIMMGRVKNEALLGGATYVKTCILTYRGGSHVADGNLLLYLCISVSCRRFNPSLCHLWPFLLSFVTVFQGYLDYQILPYTLIGPQERGSRKKIRFTALYKNYNTFLTLWFLNANWVKNQRILVQWNSDLWPPR